MPEAGWESLVALVLTPASRSDYHPDVSANDRTPPGGRRMSQTDTRSAAGLAVEARPGRAGPAAIISPNIRVRCPDQFVVGPGSIVDDFCYFSTKVRVGRCAHIASGCSVAGGAAHLFVLGDFSSLSSGVKVWCASNDFVNDVVCILPPGAGEIGARPIEGDVIFERLTGVGANAVVMPDNRVPEGTVIGALSFVPARFPFEPWSVYAGTPIRLIRRRNRDNVLAQLDRLEEALRPQPGPRRGQRRPRLPQKG
jgi:acetyltransferase-like isoleucine patch superfamily enzyme